MNDLDYGPGWEWLQQEQEREQQESESMNNVSPLFQRILKPYRPGVQKWKVTVRTDDGQFAEFTVKTLTEADARARGYDWLNDVHRAGSVAVELMLEEVK